MASENKNVTVAFVLVLYLISTALASSSGFVGNINQESASSENRSSGSGNWTAVSRGRPGQADPNTVHTVNGSSNLAVLPATRPIRSGPNPSHHNGDHTASQP